MNVHRISLAVLGLWLAAPSAHAADVTFFGIAKSQQFEQTLAGAPALLASNAFAFQAFVVGSSNRVVTNATVKPSTSTPLRQLTSDTNGLFWRFEESANTQSQLDALYPAGSGLSPTTYTMTMQSTNDGTHTATLNFWLLPPILAISYPSTPQIANLSAAQTIDQTRNFTLQWNSLGNSLTIVQLVVLDSTSNAVYATPLPFQPGALDGTSTSTVIPAGVLPPGSALTAHLSAANPGAPNTNSYVGATGIATLVKDARFPMATLPLPPTPYLQLLSVTPNQALLLATLLETNRLYHLEHTTNLTSWTEVGATNPVSSAVEFTDVLTTGTDRWFYRLRIGQ